MTDWISVHAFYQGDQDALVADAIGPVMAALSGSGRANQWFFLRYWEGGPHLRLRVRAAGADAGAVRDVLIRGLTGYLRSHPSQPRVEEGAYQRLAGELARLEQRAEYEQRLYPNDSVAVIRYQPEYDVYGRGASLDHIERHFWESSELALQVVAAGTPQSRRRGLVLSAGLLTLAVLQPDLAGVAAGFASAGSPGGRPSALDDAYANQRQRLCEQARLLWEFASAGGGGPAGGTASAAGGTGDDTAALAAWRVAGSPYSPYLGNLSQSQRLLGGILLRCTHLLANRIGIGMTEEMHVTYLMTRTLADLGARLAKPVQEAR
jgi:hypothetical protein